MRNVCSASSYLSPSADDDSGVDIPGFVGDELALSHHEGFVDLDDHPLVVLLERGPPEAADAGVGHVAAVPSAADPGGGEPHHHLHVGVAKPDEEPLGGSDDELHELDPSRDLEAAPPEPPPPASGVGGAASPADAQALVAPASPVASEPLLDN